MSQSRNAFPLHGYSGLLLAGLGWFLSWVRPAGLTFCWENAFFPLWFGYILVIDALNVRAKGHSLWTRNKWAFVGLFLFSIPGWWLFEFLNIFLQNWFYVQNRTVGSLEFAIRASIHFSIVTPAVLGTAELWAHSRFLAAVPRREAGRLSQRTITRNLLIGILMLVLVIGFPRYAFPLVWASLFLILDTVNYLRAVPSIHGAWENGRRQIIWALALGALTCGFFWEMWNYLALPKWIYQVPFVNFAHLFEMPALGYIGYLPFGLEVYALYWFCMDNLGLKKSVLYGGDDYIRLNVH